MQTSIFESDVQTIVDEATGPIVYRRNVIDPDLADTWFTALRARIHWHTGARMMYERVVDVPRFYAHYDVGDPGMPNVLLEALDVIKRHIDAPFNGIGLNLYRDEHDSVAPHNDKLHELVEHQPIVLLSLGATRTMTIRRKEPPHLKADVEMESGSLLTMGWKSQLHYDHGIPKSKHPVGARISVAFRVRPKIRSGTWGVR